MSDRVSRRADEFMGLLACYANHVALPASAAVRRPGFCRPAAAERDELVIGCRQWTKCLRNHNGGVEAMTYHPPTEPNLGRARVSGKSTDVSEPSRSRLNPPARQRRRTKAATIADVAELAGVSPMTVSRVVNDETSVRQETRDKVIAAIAALDYLPHPSTRRMGDMVSIRIGMVFNDPNVGYLNDFMIGLLSKDSLRHVQLDVQPCEVRE